METATVSQVHKIRYFRSDDLKKKNIWVKHILRILKTLKK